MDHPFIVHWVRIQTDEKLYMVTDYCRGGKLFFHLKRLNAFSSEMVKFYSAEIVLSTTCTQTMLSVRSKAGECAP